KDSTRTTYAHHLAHSLVHRLGEVPNFLVVAYSASGESKSICSPSQSLTLEAVRSICKPPGVRFVIALENYKTATDRWRSINLGSEDLLQVIKVQAIVTVEADITVYDSSGAVLFEKHFSRVAAFTKSEAKQILDDPESANTSEVITELNGALVQDIFDHFFASEVMVTQYIYQAKALSAANRHMRNGEWEAAKDALFRLDPRKKNRLRAKACYNLAVCYRALADYDQADYWYEQAAQSIRHPIPLAQPYEEVPWYAE
ncbi:MAG: DUF6340 family protein, partial [Saprospiraceae bacterium]|nr:DUF6340 family protein [Saprospiraceae bacterium]